MILDVLDLISQPNKATINVVERAPIKLVAELFAAHGQGVTARMLAQNQCGVRHPDRLRRHDFVGEGILEDSVLMNAGLVREGVTSDNAFVGLHLNASNFTPTLPGVNTC